MMFSAGAIFCHIEHLSMKKGNIQKKVLIIGLLIILFLFVLNIYNAMDDLNGFITTIVIPGAPFPEHLHNKQFCGII